MSRKAKTPANLSPWLEKVLTEQRGDAQKRVHLPASILSRALTGEVHLSSKSVNKLRRYYRRENEKMLKSVGIRPDESRELAKLDPAEVQRYYDKADFISRAITMEKSVTDTYKKYDNKLKQYVRETRPEPISFDTALNQVRAAMRKDEGRTLAEYERYGLAVMKIAMKAGYDLSNPSVLRWLSKVVSEISSPVALKKFL
jgi:hypothetical protein